ncbi:Wzz/FepE/Etk N-terminal domain-containing protein [Candidatus Sulfurimonas baltica]|uniref:Polysaccharide chain length determinant N-terminal domain-containing protein n=1 Tax=Candidatus Sulfurimonas baltica TaxID=2740404 RepID=A0A7S7RMW4_9BACT|nr:Wzz/FepE/Etk N-terminal domain-containing protein [Candidatus Sulfurimonas baltica]QOY52707.1 hypothetical protein HUE88_03180 [Candidatus Sulfurimonas baltica]
MQDNQQNIQRYEEDEIDLRELFRTLMKNRIKIVLITFFITIGAVIYAYMLPEVYEVKSNIQIGQINQELITEPETLVKTLNLVFNVEDKISAKEKFTSEVFSIDTNKKLKNFIEIITKAISNEEALKKNKEVVTYIEDLYQPKIEQYIINTKNSITDAQRDISNIENFEIKNIQRQIELLKTQRIVEIDAKIAKLMNQDIKKLEQQIELLKTQRIVDIDAKIAKLLNQDIKKLEQQIELLKTQRIVEIDKKIDFYNNIKLKTVESKIQFQTNKLKEYTESVNALYENNKLNDNTSTVISSLQMVNYQNLILNSQNKIEDLKIEKEIITNETIDNLEIEKKNILDITIKDIELRIENIKNIDIANLEKEKRNILDITIKDIELSIVNIKNIDIAKLEKEKRNISNETIRKLQHQIDVDLVTKKIKLEEKINQLQFSLSKNYINNSRVVGDYIVKDYPIAPKKKLIVVVAFVTGLILSIFLVFFMEFIKGFKEEENPGS